MVFLFILPFPFSIPLKGMKFTKECVDKVTPSVYYITKTAACTSDIIKEYTTVVLKPIEPVV